MKKFISFAVFCVVMSMAVVSCSKDDGGDPDDPAIENPSKPGDGDDSDNDQPGNVNIQAIAKLCDFGGVRLTKIGGSEWSTSFGYNKDGAIIAMNDQYSGLTIDYKKCTATITEDDFTQECKFTLDKQGRLASLSWSGEDEDGPVKLEYKFQYNDAGHLIRQTYHSDSDAGYWAHDDADVYTWEGDLLVKSVSTSTEKQGEDVRTEVSTCTFSYIGAPDNRYKQFTDHLVGCMSLDSSFGELLLVGILGKGPAKYPTCIISDYDRTDYSYTLNAKGLVEKESFSADYGDGPRVYTTTYTYE